MLCAVISIGAPVVEISPQNQNFIKLNNVSFICTAIGYPRPVIEWLKNDTVLSNVSNGMTQTKLLILSSELGDCIITGCGLNSTLWIFNTTVDDMGKYTCSASNIAGNDTATAQLTTGNINNYIIRIQYTM